MEVAVAAVHAPGEFCPEAFAAALAACLAGAEPAAAGLPGSGADSEAGPAATPSSLREL